MLTPISVISIMMMTIGVVSTLVILFFAFKEENILIAMWCIFTTLGLILPGSIMYVENVPTKADVLSGKAQYIEELNIIHRNNGTIDTVTTYSLQFKQNRINRINKIH